MLYSITTTTTIKKLKCRCFFLFFSFFLIFFANGIFLKVKYIEVVNCMHFQLHPDKLDESLTQEDRDKAYEKFLAIDQAWKLLNDQDTRAKCDRQLRGKQKSYFIYSRAGLCTEPCCFLSRKVYTSNCKSEPPNCYSTYRASYNVQIAQAHSRLSDRRVGKIRKEPSKLDAPFMHSFSHSLLLLPVSWILELLQVASCYSSWVDLLAATSL